jgi:hypothetical protein
MNEKIIQLENELAQLKQEFNNLKNSSTIPIEIDQAFRERFDELKLQITNFSGSVPKASTYRDQAVNEAGAASYNVLSSPSLFLVVNIKGTNYYIPAFT